MPKFVVGHIAWHENELRLERIDAETWQDAVRTHSQFPWAGETQANQPSLQDAEAFQQQCFDCDCMMNWIEV